MPALLTENGFIDTKTDANKLNQSSFINALAKGHAIGVAKALGLKKKATKENKPVSKPAKKEDHTPDPAHAANWKWAKDVGLFNGKDPQKSISREQAATVSKRLYDKIVKDLK